MAKTIFFCNDDNEWGDDEFLSFSKSKRVYEMKQKKRDVKRKRKKDGKNDK